MAMSWVADSTTIPVNTIQKTGLRRPASKLPSANARPARPARHPAIHPGTEIRYHHDSDLVLKAACDLQVRSVDAEDQLGSCLHRHPNLVGIEAVYADAHARCAEVADGGTQAGKGKSGGTADIDDVGPARP